ncbi:hypothetical protein ACFOU2_13660 [Bacillus songklensis]|uniref:Transcriptional regulator n=1 Tax=Bacillus songklensis TaxID=1069116 RepID=A0ABV8B539_9BACI
MKKDNIHQYESAIERARKRKANEEALEISSTGYGYESHVSHPLEMGEKNGGRENENPQ